MAVGLGEGLADLGQVGVVEVADHGARDIEPGIGEQHADGREIARLGRHDHGADFELAGERRGVERPAAAEGEQREVARVVAALDGDLADRAGHRHRGDCEHPLRRRLDRPVSHADRAGHAFPDRRGSGVAVELEPAAQEHPGADPPEHQVGVGHRGLGAAAAEGDRAGIGPRALRPDTEPPAGVDPGDRAAAGADLDDVDHRTPDREAGVVPADEIGRAQPERAALDDRAFRRGAAHVEGDQVRNAERLAIGAGADAAAHRPRFDQRYGFAQRALDRQHAAIGAHHVERALEPAFAEAPFQPRRIGRHARADDGVRRRRAAALVFVPFAGELGAGGHVDPGEPRPQALGDGAFVAVVAIGVEEGDRHRLDVEPGDDPGEPVDLLRIGLGQHLAAPVHPLVDFEAERARDQRRGAAELDIEGVGAVAAGKLESIAEPLGGDQRRPGAGALEQGVDDQRRAVLGEQGPAEIHLGLGDALHHALDQVAIGGQRLGIGDLAPLHVEGGDVGKGAPGIHGNDQRHGHAPMVARCGGWITVPSPGAYPPWTEPSPPPSSYRLESREARRSGDICRARRGACAARFLCSAPQGARVEMTGGGWRADHDRQQSRSPAGRPIRMPIAKDRQPEEAPGQPTMEFPAKRGA